MGSCDQEGGDLIDPSPAIWLEFRLLDPPAPATPPRDLAGAPASFPLFTSLPAEIRLQIYDAALLPRTILLTCKISSPAFSTFPPPIPDHASPAPAVTPRFSCPPAPALLHVSREARAFAARRYTPSFGYRISPLHTSTPLRLAPRVYFDFDRDALLLAGELEPCTPHGFHAPMVYFLDKVECSRVKRIACAADALRSKYPTAPLHSTATTTTALRGNSMMVGSGLGMGMGRVEVDDEVVFVMLSHVLDRFSGVDTVFVPFDGLRCSKGEEGAGGMESWEESGGDAIQKIWDGWVLGVTTQGSSLRGKRIPLVREEDLERVW
ncbi:uncharacterized protein DNG_08416 [Cephalotrichum gorgonifer]|uniref:2EXR domain-containing protein n=1 Tax=Cephalotrichum gorgonifer TaxID=2041049 RepID=A0AAE8SYD1_9PEZI|nr:uncharacterized protein DNG_08416 [Cephalotrichum gorgonifer]